ncbi:MAG: efflux RND transporter permease subunit [Dysgonamonadaceae bacterium]|jgi:HAE1 family hydrophobic/amphiphilic exporter-1|nr:efflux RND transporter permease subunit [Dysgonamonadaceae bacterium]MDD3356266.1 efflux RND transporter permease subunit [Dysgonamonadaceae bacterium]MDD4605159.1 efflux RND transporter permease subunit [Dysgonamonadaceae bacterium]HUI32383.1 efflux RND transporter permease subunit [Dysgonamonadaceae bacterium]
MKIYESAVKKPITTILVFVAIVLMGLFAYSRLAIDLLPEIETNQLTVMTAYAGASSSDIETNITEPLENALNAVEGLKKISSKSQDNISIITLEFTYGDDIDESASDIRDKLELVKAALPDGADNPVIFKFSTDMIPVIFYSVTAKESINALEKILDEQVANPLQRIDGVGTVIIAGAPKREIQVNAIPERLESYKLTIEQVANAIQQENINIPGGTMNVGSQTFSLRLDGEFKESDDMRNIIVSSHNGQNIYLSDVAIVNDTIETNVQESWVNGEKGAMIVIQKQSGSNTVEIAKKVRKEMLTIQESLPEDIKLDVIIDTSESIESSINSLVRTIALALIIVAFVVLFFLGKWRATFIILLTIPISLIASFFYLMATNNTLNIISLSALSIAIGLVVDDAIVVLENITSHLEKGSDPRQAAIHATGEVSISVIASTLTILAVFLPMTLITGLAGVLFSQLGWMISIIITVSTLSALTLTPMLASKMLRADRDENTWFDKLHKPVLGWLGKLDNFYSKTLEWAVSHRAITVIGSFGILLITIILSFQFIKTEFFPASDNDMIAMSVRMPTGTRMEVSREMGLNITKMLQEKFPEIERLSFNVGTASGSSFAALGENADNLMTFNINTGKPNTRSKDIFEISEEIRIELAKIPELHEYQVDPGGSGGGGFGGGGSNVEVNIFGYDLIETDEVANEIKDKLAVIEGLRDVKISRPDFRQEYSVAFDREKLALNGLNVGTASNYIRNRINGTVVSQFRERGYEYDIRVRYGEEYRQSIEDIENIILYTPTGEALRVKEIATVNLASSLPEIERQNRQRVVTVTGSIYKRALSEIVNDVNRELNKVSLPAGVDVELAGTYEDQQEAFADLFILLMISVILVYIVMASQFESLTYPMIIMISIPFSFTGSILTLLLFGHSLNVMGMIGGIMLIGIVVKNGIILIEYINVNRDRGRSIQYSVVEAGRSRLRPVLMTAATTGLGMLPLALAIGQGSEFWQSMGISVIGGLVFSTTLTLIVVPTLYAIFASRGVLNQRRKHKNIYPEHAKERV